MFNAALVKDIRTFARHPRCGVCIWYDNGAAMMQELHDTYGVDFDTPGHIWLKVARMIEMSLRK